jgi:hypothetical protein
MKLALDNSQLVALFVPEQDDGDTFIYTEMLDRGKRKGNNGHRLVKTFYHRSREEFWDQMPTIKALCDMTLTRAYTRLAPKSYERVAAQHLKMVVEAYVAKNYAGFKSLYNRACGITSPNTKLWLFDVDVINDKTIAFANRLEREGHHISTIPSKKGLHHICKPFDTRIIELWYRELGLNTTVGVEEISLHKDNPTNLYIPDGAD